MSEEFKETRLGLPRLPVRGAKEEGGVQDQCAKVEEGEGRRVPEEVAQ